MRKPTIFFALMLIGATFASPAQANSQCEALSVAAYEDDRARVAALIASGVSVNCSYSGSYVSDSTGKTVNYTTTPLSNMAWGGTAKSVRLLLSHGADVNIKDGDGNTPLDIVEEFIDLPSVAITREEWEEAEKIYRIIKQAGGRSGR